MEHFLLENVPAALLGLLFVLVAAGLGVGGLLLVRRRVSHDTLGAQNDVASALIAIVGGLYGVLPAFVVAIGWQQFEDASGIADREAVLVLSLYRNAALFPREVPELRAGIEAYARSVADDEWPVMASDQRDASATDEALNHLGRTFSDIEPQTGRETALYSEFLDRLAQLEQARQDRLLASASQLPGPLWVVLVLGGVITVGFTYFFGVASLRAHAVMVGAIAATIGLTLFLIVSLDLPFTGDVAVEPDSMRDAIAEFRHIRAG